ncbi:DUF4238 domain-containing protein [Comamonas sp. 7D-2]|nr:DUF4238 domain-containing protein [Comamonas sp. 7D-2evo1]UNV98027.1 DUF4238 domain-containing protein [Comamonas sp. 7D-2]
MHLRRFSSDNASIRLCNIASGRIVDAAPIKGQCYRDYMYGKTSEREDALGKIEGTVKKILDTVIQSGKLPEANSPERNAILLFVALQYGRTAYVADAMNDLVSKLTKYLGGGKPELVDFFENGGRIGIKNVGVLGAKMALENYPTLADLQMVLIKAMPKMEFVTSDAPVVFYNQAFEGLLKSPSTGWEWKGLQCFFPISPDYTLLLFDSSVYRVKSGNVRQATEKDMHSLNILQYVAAYDNVYFLSPKNEQVLGWREGSIRCRRKEKVELELHKNIIPKSVQKKELLIASKTDIRIGLKLSFMRISKSGESEVNNFMSLSPRPLIASRNNRR